MARAAALAMADDANTMARAMLTPTVSSAMVCHGVAVDCIGLECHGTAVAWHGYGRVELPCLVTKSQMAFLQHREICVLCTAVMYSYSIPGIVLSGK